MRQPDQQRRNLWYAVGGMLLILGIAQFDERRRFSHEQRAYETGIREAVAAQDAYFEMLRERIRMDKKNRPPFPDPPALVRSVHRPPVPLEGRFIYRARHALCVTALAVAAAMPGVWLLATPHFAQRHRRFIADAMLAFAVFGTLGMMLGVGYWRSWNRFKLHEDAAGYGLILIPLGIAAVLLARHLDRRVAAGHCPQCDYDLRGNVSGVCPECGTPVTDLSSPATPS